MTTRVRAAPDHNALYQIAEQQAGYFTTRQAYSAGFTSPLLAHHVRQGQFKRVKHGIYRFARFPEMPQADLFVALLELGLKPLFLTRAHLLFTTCRMFFPALFT